MSINADVAAKEKWTVDDIKARTDLLVEKMLELFSFRQCDKLL